jgi:hypothetical protein
MIPEGGWCGIHPQLVAMWRRFPELPILRLNAPSGSKSECDEIFFGNEWSRAVGIPGHVGHLLAALNENFTNLNGWWPL